MNNIQKKIIENILIGGAVGDAMGMPTEFLSINKIKEMFPQGINCLLPSQSFDFFGRKMKAGEITDDTKNTIFILEMLVENQGQINTEIYVQKLLTWQTNSANFSQICGPSTEKALNAIKKGIPYYETGKLGTTNGAAMKIAPIGIITDYHNLDDLLNKVEKICQPTHNTSIAISGAAIIAAIISYLVQGGQNLEELWNLSFRVQEIAQTRGFDIPGPSLKYRLKKAREISEHATISNGLSKLYQELGTGYETIETIPAVLAIVQLAKGSCYQAVKLSAMLGGDTDTIGAISGAICGGFHMDLPEEWINQVAQVNQIDFSKLALQILPYSVKNQNNSTVS